MKNRTGRKLLTAAFFVFSTSLFVSCSKEDVMEETISSSRKPKTTTTTTETPTTTTNYSHTVNWDNRSDGSYAYNHANEDFKNAIYWNTYSSITTGGKLKATLAKGVVGPSGGVMSRMDVPDASEYQLQFDMMFDSQFDWSAGGKVGFGFLVGNGQTGGSSISDGTGGSARLMWEKNSSGRVYLKPYLYFKDMSGTWGDNLGKTYPASGSIQTGTWYTVKMYIKSNTGSNTDGHIQMVINGTIVLDQAIRWTTDDTKRLINRVCFENFRGGSESYWASTTDGHLYFDNVQMAVLKY